MILDRILADTRAALRSRMERVPEAALRERADDMDPPLDMLAALRAPGVSVVAEIKRASPSKGTLNVGLAPADQAGLYGAGGADAISVLTEGQHFKGSLEDLLLARKGLLAEGLARPLLRKDFLVDAYQLVEARAYGADAVLLIVAALEDGTLSRLLATALEMGLTPLVEVHDQRELERALALSPPLIGINNRNLLDFSVSLNVTRRLRDQVPPEVTLISESGIHRPEQMAELRALGVDAALIGEALVTSDDPRATLAALKGAGA